MKRVFMLSNQLMFSRGVENLLSGRANVELVGHENDAARAVKRIQELRPDVIILDSKDPASASSRVVASILKEAPGAKVIALNLADDKIRVYHGEQRAANSVDDLLEVIDQSESTASLIAPHEWSSLALSRAQIYDLLAAIYDHPASELFLENLEASSLKFIYSLEQDNDLTGDLHDGLQALEQFQRQVSRLPHKMIQRELAEEYSRLLGCREGLHSLIPARESQYANSDPQGAELISSAINTAYAAGGLEMTAEILAQPDFISHELRFMQRLCNLESSAWTNDEHAAALKYQTLEHAFIREHLLRWLPHFCDNLIAHTQFDFYRGMACLTKGFILNEGYRVAELMEWIGAVDAEPTQADRQAAGIR